MDMNASTSNNISGCSGGVFTNFPIEWEISKWIRCVELLLTVSLNIAVIILLSRIRKRSNLVFFVINLAFSDLSVGILHILPLTVNHFTSTWALGSAICKLQFFLSNVSLYASTYLIVIIGIDRFHSVFKPLSTVRQMRHYRLLMVLSPWTLGTLISIPVLYWTVLYPICERVICTPDLRGIRKVVIVSNAFLLLFIPAVLIFLCYGMIVFLLCQRLKGQKHNGFREQDLLRSTQTSKTFTKANRRSTIITFVVGITFMFCWMPYVLAGLLNLYGTIGYGGWFDILTALSPLNSVLNPIIFLSFNHRMFKPSVSYKYSRTVETRA
ncbi:neuropeptide S receptor-like [Mytilus edulis]